MDLVFFVALICLIIYIGYRNFELYRRYRHNKEYIECYRAMLNGSDNAYERIQKYVEEEDLPEFKNKGLILKLYMELDSEIDYRKTLEEINLKQIFYKKDKYSKQLVALNSDVFIWYFLDMAKARRLSKFDALDVLNEKLFGLRELENRVEYRLAKAIYFALCEKEDAGVTFLSGLLEGNYAGLEYEKNLIGLYKRFASSTLAYSGEPMEEYYKNDLHAFASTAIGRNYMSELEIYEKYPPADKPNPDAEAEEVEENQEDKKEEETK